MLPSSPSILFINQHYWPDLASTGQHLTDLAEHLASDGFEVHVLCSRGGYVKGRVAAPKAEVRNGVSIRRLDGTGFGRGRHLGRLTDYATFYAQVAARLAFGRRYDMVVTLTTPPLLSASAAFASRVRGQRYGVWSMDLHPDAEFALGMLSPRSMPGRLLETLNAWGYREADFVVDLGECMKGRLREKDVAEDAMHTIPVWTKSSEVAPIPAALNPLRSQLGLEKKFVVMYSGNAGLAHCFEDVLDAADRLKGHEAIEFVFVGDGPRRSEVEEVVASRGLSNVRYLDYFPREMIRYSLPLGDIHLLTLRPEFSGIAVPGKLYGIMAAGRPTIVVGPEDSTPARTVAGEGLGDVIEPGSDRAGERLAETILTYYADQQLLEQVGSRARATFLRRFEQKVTCNEWSRLLAQFVQSPADAASLRHHPDLPRPLSHGRLAGAPN